VVWAPRLHDEPGGPTSITGTARFVLAIFYIVITHFQDTQPYVPFSRTRLSDGLLDMVTLPSGNG
jgi:hypothetical protein